MEITAAVVKEEGRNLFPADKTFRTGSSPVEKLIKTYSFEEINHPVEDSEKGRTIKGVLRIREFNA